MIIIPTATMRRGFIEKSVSKSAMSKIASRSYGFPIHFLGNIATGPQDETSGPKMLMIMTMIIAIPAMKRDFIVKLVSNRLCPKNCLQIHRFSIPILTNFEPRLSCWVASHRICIFDHRCANDHNNNNSNDEEGFIEKSVSKSAVPKIASRSYGFPIHPIGLIAKKRQGEINGSQNIMIMIMIMITAMR
mgnify:CR=1 FL=1